MASLFSLPPQVCWFPHHPPAAVQRRVTRVSAVPKVRAHTRSHEFATSLRTVWAMECRGISSRRAGLPASGPLLVYIYQSASFMTSGSCSCVLSRPLSFPSPWLPTALFWVTARASRLGSGRLLASRVISAELIAELNGAVGPSPRLQLVFRCPATAAGNNSISDGCPALPLPTGGAPLLHAPACRSPHTGVLCGAFAQNFRLRGRSCGRPR